MYSAQAIVDGFPGKSATHGAFGWSSLWLVEGEGRRILVDTGPPAYVPLIHAALADRGLTPSDITDVLLTHAHWDHIGNLTMFPDAVVWVGDAERRWAAAQSPGTPFLSDLHVRLLVEDERVLTPDGEAEFLPGVSSVATPGHTPGHLAFHVETADGRLLFAGDAVKNAFELATGRADSTMDAAQSTRSIERLRALLRSGDATLIPGHDAPLVLDGDRVERTRGVVTRFSYVADPDDGERQGEIEIAALHPRKVGR